MVVVGLCEIWGCIIGDVVVGVVEYVEVFVGVVVDLCDIVVVEGWVVMEGLFVKGSL